jgi:hypothetical protein
MLRTVTEVLAARTVPAPRQGGSVRRAVVLALTVTTWVAAGFVLGAGVAPGSDYPAGAGARTALVGLGLLLVAAPVALFYLPTRRSVRRQLAAVLEVTADHPVPALPPFETWGGPQRMFKRLMVSSLSYLAIPLLLLSGWAVACAFFLQEGAAAVAFAALALIPLFFLVVTLRLPHRLARGVQGGLAAGQVVPVRVDSRVDQKMVMTDAFQSWFDAVLPDGQHVLLRTPMHFSWAGDARGVLEQPDLVLVMGAGGHQGLLLAPARPADAVWLLGPVPLVRAPRGIERSFAEGRAG